MQTVMMPSKVEGGETGAQAVATPTCPVTTLYDLIAAIQDVVGPEDDALVVATVVHLLRSRQLTRMSIRGCAQVPAGIFPPKSHRPTVARVAVSSYGGEASSNAR